MNDNAKIRFLHISKTGGTALGAYLADVQKAHPDRDIRKLNHGKSFAEACQAHPDALICFSIRHPFSRFTAGFYSRQREGRPAYYHAWSPAEARLFRRFATPNELAEGLSSLNPLTRIAAIAGMRSVAHFKRTYAKALGSVAALEAHADRIGFILAQEHFEADFDVMVRALGLDPAIPLPSGEAEAHRAPTGEDRRLSEKARANLARWYADDFPIHQWCEQKRAELIARHTRA